MKGECYLRKSKHGPGVDVVRDYTAPRGSVLAGVTVTQFVEWFINEEEARQAYPDMPTGFGGTRVVSLSHLPGPDDADPKGEWSEDGF